MKGQHVSKRVLNVSMQIERKLQKVGEPNMAPLLTYFAGLPLCFLPAPNPQVRTRIHRHRRVAYIPHWRGEARRQQVWVHGDLKKDEISQNIYSKEDVNEVLTFFKVSCRVR